MRYLIGLVTGLLVAFGIFVALQPHCPTEDSCAPQYSKINVGPIHFGYWHAKEVTP